MRISTAIAAAALVCAAAPAYAATTYTDFAAFSAAAGGPLITETLDSGPDINPPATHDFGDFTLSMTGFSSLQFAIEGASGKALVGFTGDSVFTFTFDNPITAFGLKVFDLGDNDRIPIDLFFQVDGVDHTVLAGVVKQPTSQMLFAGVIDAGGITSISVFGEPNLDLFVLDDIVYAGAAVPEPATWAAMLLGFGGIGAVLRRRRALALA